MKSPLSPSKVYIISDIYTLLYLKHIIKVQPLKFFAETEYGYNIQIRLPPELSGITKNVYLMPALPNPKCKKSLSLIRF